MSRTYTCLKSHSRPGPGDAGKTGSWRVLRPVMDHNLCIPAKTGKKACFSCWLYCPEGVISRTIPPVVDLTYCKGCGVCAEHCPAGAIEMVEEAALAMEEEE